MNEIIIDYAIRLAASFVCGFCLGIERKVRQHTVGIRTLTLICVSSCLLCIVSVAVAQNDGIVKGDPGRIAAAVITGIGFLGAGAIVNQGLNIRGLTSAAIIFTSAALGVACGAKMYIPVAVVLVFSFILLLIVSKIEKKLFPADKRKLFRIQTGNSSVDEAFIRKTLEEYGVMLHDLNTSYEATTGKFILSYTGKSPENLDVVGLTKKLSEMSGVEKISIDN
ncbi:MAG: MgtC/SapB family protein [Treponema sp.]|nr:MgtC/SapB family protein [Treponema sp.]